MEIRKATRSSNSSIILIHKFVNVKGTERFVDISWKEFTVTSTFASNLPFISLSILFALWDSRWKKSRKKNFWKISSTLKVGRRRKTKSLPKKILCKLHKILRDFLWAWHFLRTIFSAFKAVSYFPQKSYIIDV